MRRPTGRFERRHSLQSWLVSAAYAYVGGRGEGHEQDDR